MFFLKNDLQWMKEREREKRVINFAIMKSFFFLYRRNCREKCVDFYECRTPFKDLFIETMGIVCF